MTDWTKTTALVAAAGALAGLVWLTRPAPKEAALISDQGQPLAPALTDPLAVKALEVISYDDAAAKTRAFKVAFDGKRWIIPSHSGYPADAAEKVSAAASAFAGLIKERVVTDNKNDHAALGVLSPDDDTNLAAAGGTGTRVTLRDASDRPLVDVIIGKAIKSESSAPFEQPSSKRYIREAGQNRVYITSLGTGFSTKFGDWVVTDLLQTTAEQISSLVIDRYRVDEQSGLTKDPVSLTLAKLTLPTPPPDPNNPAQPPPAQSMWSLSGTPPAAPSPGETIATPRIDEAVAALTGLKIVGVRPKPANLAKALSGAAGSVSLTLPDQISLSSRGFYLAQGGRLLANEGQLSVKCTDGVIYLLWFGEVVPDSEDAASGGQVGGAAAAGAQADKTTTPSNARYMMITVAYDPTIDPEPKKPLSLVAAETAFEDIQAQYQTKHAKPAEPKPEGAAPDQPKSETEPKPADAPAEPPSAADEPPKEPPELAGLRQQHEATVAAWKTRAEAGKKRAETLGKRFADWYYVISADSLGKIRPSREELVKPAEPAPAAPPSAQPEPPVGVPAPPASGN